MKKETPWEWEPGPNPFDDSAVESDAITVISSHHQIREEKTDFGVDSVPKVIQDPWRSCGSRN